MTLRGDRSTFRAYAITPRVAELISRPRFYTLIVNRAIFIYKQLLLRVFYSRAELRALGLAIIAIF